jgi:transcriptional pleiotropic regulator of transition state genes
LATTGVYWIKKKKGKKMKATGIVRKVDELGRVVLPVELRKTFDIKKEDPLEIYVDGDSIILKKYQPACIFCGDAKNVKRIHEKIVCENCIAEMKSL